MFRPLDDRQQPAIWVRKLAVWRHWAPEDNRVMRTLELRRGLNILWARSSGDESTSPRIGGHGAGKTTFCRLLRFLLDEKQPGTSEFRQDFRNRYSDGWVLGEVMINGQVWLIGKTLSDRAGRHHFAIAGADLGHAFEDKPPRGGHSEYQLALENAALGRMQIRELSGSAKRLEWKNLLTWLSRDQEAHYAGLLTWRDTASESEAPELSAADRENLVRLVLGLVEKEEQRLLRDRAQAANSHEEKLKQKAPLEILRDRAKTTLETLLEKPLNTVLGSDTHSPEDPVLQKEVEDRAVSLEQEAAKAIAEAGLEEETKTAQAGVVEKTAFQQIQNAALASLQQMLNERETELEPKQVPPKPKPTQVEMNTQLQQTLSRMTPFQGYCSKPKAEAIREGCPLFKETTRDPVLSKATDKQEQRDDAREARLRREITEVKGRIEEQQKAKEAADQALLVAKDYLRKVQFFVNAETTRLSTPAVRAKALRDALTAYQNACSECDTLTQELTDLDTQKKNLDADIERHSSTHQKVVSEFGELFDHLAKGLVGDQVKGRIRLAGKGIQPELHYHGRRKSAALDLAKLLAFDLSCLALGMTSAAAHHPRFILHDSPRESDLSVSIYHGLFRMARMLETASIGEPAFQYIVTTTEAPPEELKQAPWLLNPVLDSNEAASRFLGEDLAV
jgi:hypothetical protein